MLKLLRLFLVLAAAALALLVTTPVANAQQLTILVAQLSAEPQCGPAVESGATGYAVVTVNEASGRITYRVVAFDLPGTISAAHIHVTETGSVALGLELTGVDSGVVATGTTIDRELAAAIVTNPENYYFNVHTGDCRGGAIRGQLEPLP